ncbi:MAG: transporter substrate-binding domain-containing protein [Halobacteriovoraceae bacterium]|nr:transporter substrate-binding domain-containing protein [Halobacteriovoraceae bacterium]
MFKTVLLCALFTSKLYSQTVTLSTLNWPPFIGNNLKKNGVVAEVVREALKIKGHELKLEFEDWDTSVSRSKSGKTDGLFPEYFDESRRTDFIFSDAFMSSPLVLAVKKGSKVSYSGNISDIEKIKIGVVKGYVNTIDIDTSKKINKTQVASDLANLLKVSGGKIDAAVIDETVAKDIITNIAKQLKDNISFLRPTLEDKMFYIAWSNKGKNQKNLISDFNFGLKTIKKTGLFDKILKEFE